MANELTRRIAISGARGGFTYPQIDTGSVTFDQAATGYFSNTQNVGTSAEDLVMPTDFSSLGYAYLKNLDTVNYVDVGVNDGGSLRAMGRLKPGQDGTLPLKPGITLMAQANTAAVRLFYQILEA